MYSSPVLTANILVLQMSTQSPYFFTATILNWNPLFENNQYKNIIIDSLRYCVFNKDITINALVIMINHIHLIWRQQRENLQQNVKHDFLKYTAQQIIMDLTLFDPEHLKKYKVNAGDRKYQVWERNPLSIELYSEKVFRQKLNYLHFNPVKAGLCICPEDYYYSSARFYATGIDGFGFLRHYRDY